MIDLDISELDKLESLESSIPLNEDMLKSYNNNLMYISNKLLNIDILKETSYEDIIQDYNTFYNDLSDGLTIAEMLHVYKDCKSLLEDIESPVKEYTEEDFEYNGFIKSEFVIHEHDSKRAPLHWDLRWKTEFKTSAYSFVLLKHKLPDDSEKLLVKQQPMHPTQWVDMVETVIGHGYGQGSVKTIDRGTIYYKRKDNSFALYLDGNIYKGAYFLININNSNFLIFKATKSILASQDERNVEWKQYAKNFIEYLNKIIYRKYNINNLINTNSNIEIVDRYEDFNHIDVLEQYNRNNIIYIPSIQYCLENRKNSSFINFYSKECKINNIEDIMRLFILRRLVSYLFFNYLKDKYSIDVYDIYDKVRDVPYTDNDLENLKNTSYLDYQIQKVYRMFSDIFLGHKFYGQFDFERFLINLLSKSNPIK